MRKALLVVSLVAVLVLALGVMAVSADSSKNYVAHLQGGNEVPAVDSQAQGQAIFHFDFENNTVTYKLIVANVENVTMAHIHVALTPGGNGAPAVWLYPSAPPPSLIPGRFDGTLVEGTFTPSNFVGPLAGTQLVTLEDLQTAIEEGRAYVNVHTSQFGGGEIRGTIR